NRAVPGKPAAGERVVSPSGGHDCRMAGGIRKVVDRLRAVPGRFRAGRPDGASRSGRSGDAGRRDEAGRPDGAGQRVGAWRRAGLILSITFVTLGGPGIALRVAGHIRQEIGPFTAPFQLHPALTGGPDVEIPPLGSLQVATHDGPAGLSVTLDS